ncbi:MAG: UDP-N-acetylglucosamine 2-epimerase [Sulfuricellaceae bacterium]|jgi:GDP/UDP-N,N'-diacetylbacillosamine 2-epimerase (hydrolysing)
MTAEIRRICVITGTRAEYGQLRWLLHDLKAKPAVKLQIVAAAMHLAPEFGFTYREIESDGFVIDRKLEMLVASDTGTGMAKSTGLGTLGFADIFAQLQPHVIVVLGDRFEVLAAATAALLMRIPIAHLHGGELTEGAVDDSIRHAVSKMASLHFTAAEPYRNRLLQMGEAERRVFNVGSMGVDAIMRTPRMGRVELEKSLGFSFGARNLLVTFHPATAEDGDPLQQCEELLSALDAFPECKVLITLPNADAGGRGIAARLQKYAADNPQRICAHASLGLQRYLSCLAIVDGVVGNSSSGLLEAPSFKIGTVNIGSRQKGRIRAASVIDCPPQREAITRAIGRLYEPDFREVLNKVRNPLGEGGSASRIADILADYPLHELAHKAFCDMSPKNILSI